MKFKELNEKKTSIVDLVKQYGQNKYDEGVEYAHNEGNIHDVKVYRKNAEKILKQIEKQLKLEEIEKL